MGRHSAPDPIAEHPGNPALEPRRERVRPVTRSPITDPTLFDRPSVPALDRALIATVAGPLSAPAPAVLAPTPSRLVPASAGPFAAGDVDEAGFGDVVPASPSLRPVAARMPGRSLDTGVTPIIGGRSLSTGRVDTVRPPRQQAPKTKVPTSFIRGREAALAACAVAVVGAVSGVAAILPTSSSEAQAANRQPMLSPTPQMSGSTASDSQVCFSPQQLRRAMRAHHHRHASPGTQAPQSTSRPTAMPTGRPVTPAGTTAPSQTTNPGSSSTPTSASTSTTTPGAAGALPANPSNLGAGTFSLRDFSTQSSGAIVSGGVLKGAGVGKTVVQMSPNSSTKASVVPGNGNGQGGLANPTNPLYLLRGVSDLENVTVQGTEQGHMYNGLYMTGANLVIKHAEVNNIPGNYNGNPGETFAVGVNRASGTATVDDLTINGGTGSLVSAAGLGINNSDADWNISDLTTNNLKWSAGLALWQVRGTFNVHNYVQSGGARSLGAERMAGKVNLYDPVWSAGTTGHDITYTWDGGYSGGSINFYYSSASKVPTRKLVAITNKVSGIASSIHVFVGGVEQKASDYVTVR